MTQDTIILLITMILSTVVLVAVIIWQQSATHLTKKRRRSRIALSELDAKALSSKIVEACRLLSESKTGAIITIEKKDSLQDYLDIGVELDALFTPELMMSIFNKHSVTHDGAVIIRGRRVLCCSTYYPMSQEKMNVKYGSRHRASLQLSSVCDAISIIVSEESGGISIAKDKKLKKVDLDGLLEVLLKDLV